MCTTTCGCFRHAEPYWRFPFDWLKWLLFMLFKLFMAVVGETMFTFVELLLLILVANMLLLLVLLLLLLLMLLLVVVVLLLLLLLWEPPPLIFKLLKLLDNKLLVICELGLIRWLLFNWFSIGVLTPHAFSSVNISVKYPGSALMRSIFVLILLTMRRHLKIEFLENKDTHETEGKRAKTRKCN